MGKRGRAKTNKEYAIRISHPNMGDFYYSHYNENGRKCMFTQDLSKVSKWKTKKIVEDFIKNYLFDCKYVLVINLGKVDTDYVTTDKNKYVFRKRLYYSIPAVAEKGKILEYNESMELVYDSLKKQLVDFNNLLTDDDFLKKQYEKENRDILNKFVNNINMFKKYQNNIIKYTKDLEDTFFVDIVNASFNFRTLKIKTLNIINEKD